MRHELTPCPIPPGPRGMGEAPAAGLLVTASGFAHIVPACDSGAVPAVPVAAVTPAADEDLHPATGAQVQTASDF
ncbi:hypothetical protein [Paraburkholderia kururiensis]|uniref:hypothetical protein n=1 Tax=Paraburkholderia kururiensis TaxID=984307 RepID=UPI000F8921ED|nr:hypothetical protein [Paraburkholderia kururiensis]